jgi:threonine aldolase
MKQIWTGRLAQAAGKYGEHAPMATVCCNACRTCVTTNIFALGGAVVAGVGYKAARFARRFIKTSTA